ncbi:histidine phosphatase family protein [Kaistia dalseonensis]|uniref:Phosphoglycerate mutase n=1 Tax=Kaistia dalseonensis TaxID=410840 RepID=A0ABU0HCH9_9HYPH|nr:histidine phosphatase family protein [Kaistia dalseonensis]MCX5497377.1 histidine phosphatase family protein [Kaistia dalseonensis]MDQ0440016.1 putative phosphoglycerate mutase [Kaistia dalseonensis]
MPIIVFIRHGETDWNVEGRFQGQRDIPLNARGRGQARRNGLTLADIMPETKDFDFVASPLGRTRETMEIVRGAMGLDPSLYRQDPTLKEITFGQWEGFTGPELKALFPERVHEREADKWDFVPPGGESYAMLSMRIKGWLDGIDTDTVVVSHGGVCRVLRGLLLKLDPSVTPMLDVPQDKVFVWNGQAAGWI